MRRTTKDPWNRFQSVLHRDFVNGSFDRGSGGPDAGSLFGGESLAIRMRAPGLKLVSNLGEQGSESWPDSPACSVHYTQKPKGFLPPSGRFGQWWTGPSSGCGTREKPDGCDQLARAIGTFSTPLKQRPSPGSRRPPEAPATVRPRVNVSGRVL